MRAAHGPPFDVPPGNVADLFLGAAKRTPDAVAFHWRDALGATRSLTYSQVEHGVREVAAGLVGHSILRGERVAIVAETRPEWGLADLGIQAAGAVTTTVFTTLAPDQMAFQLRDSQSHIVFLDNAAQMTKLRAVASSLSGILAFVAFDEDARGAAGELAPRVTTLDALRAKGRALLAARPDAVDERVRATRAEDDSTIIYTSGTTGIPKGAVLTHRNCVAAARMPTQAFRLDEHDDRRTVVFLPLAHSLTRAIFLNGIDLSARIGFGSPRSLVDDLRSIEPRLVASAPRIYERIHDQYMQQVQQATGAKRRIMERARAVAIAYGAAVADGKRAPLGLSLQRALYDRLVYSKLRAKLGFTHLQLALSGAAAIRPELLHFFRGFGILIVEAWGLTETTAPGTTNPPERVRPGTVGLPFPGVSVALGDEDEILIRGPNVFKGYHERPDENKEAFVEIDGERWFRTGDVGRFDEAGFLKIVDRKKELEVLDTGKKIAPIAVEEMLKTVSPFVAESCLIGTGRKFAGALVQPNYDRLVAWAKGEGVPFDASRVVVKPDPTGQPMTYAVGDDLLSHAKVRALYEAEVAKCNERVADYERIRVFRLVPHAFTIDRDELTVKLSKKRRNIVKNHEKLIEEMFTSRS